ncbi:di-heme oxidoredictase family protein [Flavobacterium gawalongense]|uniref:Thiol oxidoreductase n=1 Tax=Flavobacterium gawalongense TaxID=2594432 RepID=A0A553BK43_9FLAO|nr:di-heme oxidoredictase family protein [Flavobacterium gawalongense]TRX00328.1 thiol oxidoreductase [Flavobacterium gawalongense]TRX08386.1 thiol oxidoreductase [Flavobacterium gawalongense]TRX08618.1 thiol oxidoreductase [Flavobacterium gawalongense]TRX09601.1 thiol oxidoreductase [Flavobacterium gawalongense]TRX25610.1 thiol oxidoreductase [Flavobacterium gawalongense]
MKTIRVLFGVIPILLILLFISCDENYTEIPADDEVLDGTVEGLSHEELARFLKGDAAFNEVFTRETGLGPTFVSTSCISCHAGDGKGHPSTTLTRFGQIDETGNLFLNQGGPQLQNRGLPGFLPEQIAAGATFAKFTPPANTGLGFLQFVTDADIMAMTDPNDSDGDGISGVPNWIDIPDFVMPSSNAISQNGKYIGRYGKKAAAHSLLHQTANAYNQDMGITSIFRPIDAYTNLEIDPEITTSTVNDVVFYLQTLKAPIQRNQSDAVVNKGAAVFNQINCTGCHKSELKTGYSPIKALSNKTFAPYTDLLLHDMGSGLDDGYTEGNAKTHEWKTPPLWGIGLSQDAQGGSYFLMHDGRARSIEEAILMHGGEASKSKSNFQNLSQPDKEALLKFIKSL